MSKEESNIWTGVSHRTVKFRTRWAPLARWADEIVRLIPSYADTRKGRRNAAQVKVAEGAIGLAIIAFGGRSLIPLGVILASFILFVPMRDLRKREIRAAVKRWKTGTRREALPAEIRFDGRRVELWVDGQKERRVLWDRGQHLVQLAECAGRELAVLRGPSKKKREHVWILGEERFSGNGQSYALEDTDKLVEVDSATFAALVKRLGGETN